MTSTCSISAELNGVTIDGADEDATYVLLADSIGGLGLPEPRLADLERNDEHGTVAGADHTTSRVLRLPIAVQAPDDPHAAMVAFRALKAAWQPTGPTDDVLSISLPGYGPSDDVVRFYGRPRTTLEANLGKLHLGVVYALATFVALDPIGYGPTESAGPSSGTFAVVNAGDATSKRATIEVVGNGGTPVLVNNTDGGADVRFSQALAGATSWFIDLAARTVVDGSGNDVFPDNVLAASLWPRLVPGSNSFTLTGAGSATFSYRSGWW